ncbi:MAG: putative phage abortive infection protein [Pseudomonadota bacterium]
MKSPPNEKGDTFAGLAGSLAFLWIIITVLLQGKELSLQREEIVKTNDHLKEQNFDSFFFELISTHNSIVDAIDIRKKSDRTVIRRGRDSFGFFLNELKLDPAESRYPHQAEDKTLEKYERMYKVHHSDLGHYFRFLYNSMRAIEESEVAKKKHRRLFRALFSDDELLIIFYNVLSDRGKKLIPYIESFEFFDNIPTDRLIYKNHRDLLNPICFGENQ